MVQNYQDPIWLEAEGGKANHQQSEGDITLTEGKESPKAVQQCRPSLPGPNELSGVRLGAVLKSAPIATDGKLKGRGPVRMAHKIRAMAGTDLQIGT